MRVLLSVLTVALVTSSAAYASGWDWEEDFAPAPGKRHWTPTKLDWAQGIHPDTPTYQWIVQNFDPPSEELWCHDQPDPLALDCDIHETRINNWIHYFLDIPLEEELPGGLDPYPPECSSYCYP